MSEYQDSGLTKPERYSMSRNQVNQDFDKKIENKSFFTSKTSIQEEREIALKKVYDQYWGSGNRGGSFCTE